MQPPIGIGANCVIDRAIIDKNARIADGVVITPEGKPKPLEVYKTEDGWGVDIDRVVVCATIKLEQ